MEKGWRGFREVNRVRFDREKVTIGNMVEWLKDAGTYLETLEQDMTDKGDGL